MHDAPPRKRKRLSAWLRSTSPSLSEISLTTGSALLIVLSFPDFDLWPLTWVGLTPFLFVLVRTERVATAFVIGWTWGVIFFYGTCWWLTYPMIHYAGISAWLAYPLLLLPVMIVALFPALFAALLAQVIQRFGDWALILAPVIWASTELLRYAVTGQLWNALGYSQAFHPIMIQSARWGGVYAVSFLIVEVSSAAVLAIVQGSKWRRVFAMAIASTVFVFVAVTHLQSVLETLSSESDEVIVAVQPDVPMDVSGDPLQMSALLDRHLQLSSKAVDEIRADSRFVLPRLVIWPESPMNFSYSRDPHLREVIGNFARANHTSILLNSLEPSKDGGDQNSAILVNEKGEMSARYDKIRLMPFGEYVPLPRWLPGARSVRGIVGEFTPGSSYTLMPLGAIRAGVFICIEAAHPGIARTFTDEGADVLINISNDGYLGPTPVMRQHLANAIFRAVENDRPIVRVTNAALTAFISPSGRVLDETNGFQQAGRTWTLSREASGSTFYSRHGDLFAYGCALISLGFFSASFMRRRPMQ